METNKLMHISDSINTLKELAQEKNAPYTIEGNQHKISIQFNPQNRLYLILFLVVNVPFLLLFVIGGNPEALIVPGMGNAMLLLLCTFIPSSHDITVDFLQQKLQAKSNNIIGKYTRPTIVVDFKDYKGLDTKSVFLKNSGGKVSRVSIKFKETKKMIIEYPHRPSSLAADTFVEAFDRLLQTQK